MISNSDNRRIESDRMVLCPFLGYDIAGDGEWYIIIGKEDNAAIGLIGMVHRQPRQGNTGIQIVILEEKKRRAGYGLEALELLEQYIFDVLGYHRIAVRMADFNKAAIGFFKKAGYKLEGVQEQGGCQNDRYYDVILMRLLYNEYALRRKAQ